MGTQPSLRARILPRFPAQVLAGTGITITKSGGTYTFAAQAYANIPINALASIPEDRLLGRDTPGVGSVEVIGVAGGLGFTGSGSLQLTVNHRIRGIPAILLIGATPSAQDTVVPYSCTITKVTVISDATSGNPNIAIQKGTFATFPTGLVDITGGNPPVLFNGKYQSTTLTGWNLNIAAGEILRMSSSTGGPITRLNITIEVLPI